MWVINVFTTKQNGLAQLVWIDRLKYKLSYQIAVDAGFIKTDARLNYFLQEMK